MTLGQTINKLRKGKGWKQMELAKQLGVTQSMVAKWEADQARPRPQAFKQLAEALEVRPEDLEQKTSEIQLPPDTKPALKEIWQHLSQLSEDQLEALRVVVRDMTMKSQMETLFRQGLAS